MRGPRQSNSKLVEPLTSNF